MKTGISRKNFIKKGILATLSLNILNSYSSLFHKNYSLEKERLRNLGRTGLKVTSLGMGATRTMEPAVIKAALDSGINFFDTGRVYAGGNNEIMLGKVFEGIRNEVIIQSKLRVPGKEKLDFKDGVNEAIKSMESSVHESMKALNTDYIDVMLLHGMLRPEITYNDEIMKFMEKIRKEGKVRAIGFSSHSNMIELIRKNNEILFYDVIMCPFNHKGSYKHSRSKRYSEWDQPELTRQLKTPGNKNIGIVAMKTTSGGPFKPEGRDTATYEDAVRWVIQHDFICSAVVGMSNFEEITENAKVME
jgi:aryl-alcohol dehydrogenase-like predicted oxidoreductase